jgi:hypothetical protein
MSALHLKELCSLGRRKNAMSKQKGWCISKISWCVGSNPPFVVCGIRLIGLPAPSGRFFIGVCLPFPLAGRPFHRFHSSGLCITNASWPFLGGRFVSAPLPDLSVCPRGTAILRVGGVSSPQRGDSHAPTHQPIP